MSSDAARVRVVQYQCCELCYIHQITWSLLHNLRIGGLVVKLAVAIHWTVSASPGFDSRPMQALFFCCCGVLGVGVCVEWWHGGRPNTASRRVLGLRMSMAFFSNYSPVSPGTTAECIFAARYTFKLLFGQPGGSARCIT